MSRQWNAIQWPNLIQNDSKIWTRLSVRLILLREKGSKIKMKSPATAGQQILKGLDLRNVLEYKSQQFASTTQGTKDKRAAPIFLIFFPLSGVYVSMAGWSGSPSSVPLRQPYRTACPCIWLSKPSWQNFYQNNKNKSSAAAIKWTPVWWNVARQEGCAHASCTSKSVDAIYNLLLESFNGRDDKVIYFYLEEWKHMAALAGRYAHLFAENW